MIYVGSNDGHFYAIDRDGRVVWKYKPDNRVGAFKLSANGTVYFVNHSKRLYALDVESKGMVDSSWPTFQGDNQTLVAFTCVNETKLSRPCRHYTSRSGARSENGSSQLVKTIISWFILPSIPKVLCILL